MNVTPQLQFGEGLIARSRTSVGLPFASIASAFSTSCRDACLFPRTCTVSLSQPITSTEPLKLSTSSRPPGASLKS